LPGALASLLPENGEIALVSSVNMRSGLTAVGALRPEEVSSQEPIATEVAVTATGARPGGTSARRELFTEETVTVLIFERGAVIRLSAGVADGQLLFLTNKKTGKEVVTQVLRKRAFRPTNCYVDLEFTEDCPGFWGIEFPKAAAPTKESIAEASKNLGDEPEPATNSSDAPPAQNLAAPSVEDVDQLKSEVAQLQAQLKSLLQATPSAAPGAASATKAAAKISAEIANEEEEQRFAELLSLEAKQDQSNLPKRLVAYPGKSTKKTTVENVRGKLMVLATAVVVLAALGSYQFGLLDALTKKPVAAKPAQRPPAPTGNALAVSAPIAPKSTAANLQQGSTLDTSPRANSAPTIPAPEENSSSIQPSSSVATNKAETNALSATKNFSSVSTPANSDFREVSPSTNPAPGNPKLAEAPSARSAGASSHKDSGSSATPATVSPASVATAEFFPGTSSSSLDYVAPKLLKAVKPVAPAEALRNYITGDVNANLLIDSTGHVKSVSIISGPAKLRTAALNFAKQYVYEPAKRNGKPVLSHVQVKLQFWYEP
jgi:hypothetical protein